MKARVKFGVKETILWKFHLSPWDEGRAIRDALPNVLYSNRCFTVVQPGGLLLSLTIQNWKEEVGSAVKTCCIPKGGVTDENFQVFHLISWISRFPFLSWHKHFIYTCIYIAPTSEKCLGTGWGRGSVFWPEVSYITIHCKGRPTCLEDWYLWPGVTVLLFYHKDIAHKDLIWKQVTRLPRFLRFNSVLTSGFAAVVERL